MFINNKKKFKSNFDSLDGHKLFALSAGAMVHRVAPPLPLLGQFLRRNSSLTKNR
jgi:hypothetical protein